MNDSEIVKYYTVKYNRVDSSESYYVRRLVNLVYLDSSCILNAPGDGLLGLACVHGLIYLCVCSVSESVDIKDLLPFTAYEFMVRYDLADQPGPYSQKVESRTLAGSK